MPSLSRSILLPVAALGALALAGCATPAAPATDDGTIRIVASTSAYGDVAEQIGGDLVTVTSIITSGAQDPHSYEASARDQLTLSEADLVIENGGGYDPFIDTLLEAAGTNPAVVNASEASGLLEADHDHAEEDEHAEDEGSTDESHEGHDHIEGFNEHVWYSFHAVEHIAEEITHELSELDPDNAAVFEANYESFAASIAGLESRAEELKALIGGSAAAVTEPVPVYLLESVGLTNETPDDFTEAIEEGSDVPPLALQETLALFTDGAVVLLAYNEQTASPETERVRESAEAAGIPVVSFAETMPEGSDYISWMTANLDSIAEALA